MAYSDALAISEPIRLVVTRHNNDRGESDLVGTYDLDWRCVLTDERGKWSGTAELSGVGSESKISSGVLELKLEMFPKSPSLEKVYLSSHRESERQQISESERLFLVYSRQWWKEYLQIRPEHSHRMVKIFAMDEAGRNRCVCSFVWPLRAGRLLDGPRQAARFVSLVPCERWGNQVGVGGRGSGDVWSSLHTVLCLKKGVSCIKCFFPTTNHKNIFSLFLLIGSFSHTGIGRPLLFTRLTVARLRSGCLRLYGNQEPRPRPLLGGYHRQRGGRDLLGEPHWTKVSEETVYFSLQRKKCNIIYV